MINNENPKKNPEVLRPFKFLDPATETILNFCTVTIFTIFLTEIMSGREICLIVKSLLTAILICLSIAMISWIKGRISRIKIRRNDKKVFNLINNILENPIVERYPQLEVRLRKPCSDEAQNTRIRILRVENSFLNLEKKDNFFRRIIPIMFRNP